MRTSELEAISNLLSKEKITSEERDFLNERFSKSSKAKPGEFLENGLLGRVRHSQVSGLQVKDFKFLDCEIESSRIQDCSFREGDVTQVRTSHSNLQNLILENGMIEVWSVEDSKICEIYLKSFRGHCWNLLRSRVEDFSAESFEWKDWSLFASILQDGRVSRQSCFESIKLIGSHFAGFDVSESQLKNCEMRASAFNDLKVNKSLLLDARFDHFVSSHLRIEASQFESVEFKMRYHKFGIFREEAFQNIYFENCHFKNVKFAGNSWNNLRLKNVRLENLEIKNSILQDIQCENSEDLMKEIVLSQQRFR